MNKGNKMKKRISLVLAMTILGGLATLPAMAEGHHGGHGWGGERDIRHFGGHHFEVWRGGEWRHARHDGRLGWWWIAGGMWYFYPQPVYPYPDPYTPPVVVVQTAPAPVPQPPAPTVQPQQAAQVWYYCEASKTYYPYVSSCPAGWKTVPATPAATPTNQ